MYINIYKYLRYTHLFIYIYIIYIYISEEHKFIRMCVVYLSGCKRVYLCIYFPYRYIMPSYHRLSVLTIIVFLSFTSVTK